MVVVSEVFVGARKWGLHHPRHYVFESAASEPTPFLENLKRKFGGLSLANKLYDITLHVSLLNNEGNTTVSTGQGLRRGMFRMRHGQKPSTLPFPCKKPLFPITGSHVISLSHENDHPMRRRPRISPPNSCSLETRRVLRLHERRLT